MLPTGWNASQDVYALLYQPSDSEDTHLLKCIAVDGSMLVHILVSSTSSEENYYKENLYKEEVGIMWQLCYD